MSARQQFIAEVEKADPSLAQLALLAVQILKSDSAAAQEATKDSLQQIATLIETAKVAGCDQSLPRLVQYMRSDLGFEGNALDYYAQDNSDLSQVLRRRSGIPITLAIVYIEIGRALGYNLKGVGFPGHFLVGSYNPDNEELALIDPFEGKLTDRKHALAELARAQGHEYSVKGSVTGWSKSQTDAWFLPANAQQIGLRLLENLKQIHVQVGRLGQALAAVELQLLLAPSNTQLLQQQSKLSQQIFGGGNSPAVH